MSLYSLKTIVTGGSYFEGPRWHDGLWWVSDLHRRGIYAYDTDGNETQVIRTEHKPSGLGWMPNGDLLYVTMDDHKVWRRTAGGETSLHAEVGSYCSGELNDMVVDDAGRAYVGDIGFDAFGGELPKPTNVVMIDPDGTVTVAASDLVTPNGMVITDDRKTLVVAESVVGRCTAFDIADDGSLSNRRPWAIFSDPPEEESLQAIFDALVVLPDGCAIDVESAMWIADPVGKRCLRVADGGTVLDEVPAPESMAIFACALGGDDGRTLLMCAAPANVIESSGQGGTSASLLTTQVSVPHGGLP
jgi:sugar lactone lactonase YvrE